MSVVQQQGLNLPDSIPLHSVTVWQKAAEGQADKMVSDMEADTKQICVNEFLHTEKNSTLTFTDAF